MLFLVIHLMILISSPRSNDNNNVGNLVNQLNSESIGQLTFDIIINTILDGWHSWQNYFTKALHLSTHDLADLKKIYLQ